MTTDGDALFRAVCESPADDTSRLVYADWLDEYAAGLPPDRRAERHARAELIRVQIEAARCDPDDPERPTSQARAEALLASYGLRWGAELTQVLGVQWDGIFRRGFVEGAAVVGPGCFLQAADVIFAVNPVRRLILQGLDTANFGPVLRCRYMRRL
jgi:uncharacterized protein (TIGR02996 family)